MIFPGVHHAFKFALLSVGPTEAKSTSFSFFLRQVSALSEPERNFALSPDQIAAINPNTRTAPVFRSRADAELTAKIYRYAPVLINEGEGAAGNPWEVAFRQGLFNMTTDSGLFRTAAQAEAEGFIRDGTDWVRGAERLVPLYEAKMIHQFDHRWASYYADREDSADVSEFEKGNPNFEPAPRYWVPGDEVSTRLAAKGWSKNWMMGWRDITNATNERTVIAAVLPRVGVGHVLPLIFMDATPSHWAGLLGNLCALSLDYCARQALGGTHLTYGYLKQFPILHPNFYTEPRLAFITPKVLELTYTSHSLAPFARDLGHDGPPFAWDEDRRAHLRADLDAFYARAYGLTRDELRYILDPADVKGSDYPSETFRVLKEKEIRQHGFYRTQRLVLEAWDRMEADGTFGDLGLGAGQISAPAPIVERPVLANLADGTWARSAHQPYDAGAALTAILKAINGPTRKETIRFAAALVLEPHLLTALLPPFKGQEWRRLVGKEAEPRTGNVVGFAARTNQGWGTSVSSHRGNGRLIEDLSAGTWAPGPGLDVFDTAGWPNGRASFVLDALRSLDLASTVSLMPDEVRDWIAHVTAA